MIENERKNVVANDDLLDEELMSMPGLKVSDITKDVSNQRKPKNDVRPVNKAKKQEPQKMAYEPVVNENDWMIKLKSCTKWSLIFGGLELLLFYWQQTGQMLPSAAVPSMIVCALLAGLKIGMNIK